MTLAATLLAAIDTPDGDSGAFGRMRRPAGAISKPQAQSSTDPSDADLLVRIRAGDEQAFERLFERYLHPLTIVATAVAHSPDAADDVVQAIFLRLWRRRDAITVRGNVAQYLRSAVYNEAKNVLIHDARHHRRGEHAVNMAEMSTGRHTPDVILDDRELADRVRQAIEALPERAGDVFRLWFYSDLSYAEIAETLGLSVKGVEQGRARAVAALRQTLLPLLKKY